MLKKALVLALLVLSTALPISAAETAKGPKIFYPQSEYDFGKTLEGNRVEHIYTVENRGTEELRIQKVKPG